MNGHLEAEEQRDQVRVPLKVKISTAWDTISSLSLFPCLGDLVSVFESQHLCRSSVTAFLSPRLRCVFPCLSFLGFCPHPPSLGISVAYIIWCCCYSGLNTRYVV